jgi:hypothetical protein
MKVTPDLIEKFHSRIEKRCFILVIEAYNHAIEQKSIPVTWDENDITIQLNEYIDENPKRQDWNIVTNCEHLLLKNKKHRNKGFSKKLPRIDLRFISIQSKYEYKLFMEAKILKEKDSKLKRRYISTGIDSFVKRKYENGFLAGYILAGNLENTIQGINDLLVKDKRIEEIIKIQTEKISGHDMYLSIHPSLQLKHFFFDFTQTGQILPVESTPKHQTRH